MAQVCGLEPKEIITSDNGNLARPMDMEFMFGSMEIGMKDNSNNLLSTGQEQRDFRVEKYIKDSFIEGEQTATVNIFGPTEATIKEILKMVLERDMEYGSYHQETAINMKVNILMAKSMATVYLLGVLEIFTKEIIFRISVTAMDRCIGQMEAITKEIGEKESRKARVKFQIFRNHFHTIIRSKERNFQTELIGLDNN